MTASLQALPVRGLTDSPLGADVTVGGPTLLGGIDGPMWAAIATIAGALVTVALFTLQLRKRRFEREAEELLPLRDLLCSTLLLLDDLDRREATRADLVLLLEKRSRIDHAVDAWPGIPLTPVVALITAYETTALPDRPHRLRPRKDRVGQLLLLSRKQGAAIGALRTALLEAKRVTEELRRRR
ncbi:hypothetical protein ABZ490_07070 [Streptomyces sp. NPDC005811]|uniref:hypothetical protein n=1 Tax=Streptomyces sp. NPDC005811 TaxID=3154565 RepID=UPI0033CFDBD2